MIQLVDMQASRKTYRNSSCFNLEIEKGMSPYSSLNDKSLITSVHQYSTNITVSYWTFIHFIYGTYRLLREEQSPISSGICPERRFPLRSLIKKHTHDWVVINPSSTIHARTQNMLRQFAPFDSRWNKHKLIPQVFSTETDRTSVNKNHKRKIKQCTEMEHNTWIANL